MEQTAHGDKGPRVIAAAACVIVIQVAVVALRFWSRALSSGTRFWWDDWMVFAALPCSLVLCAIYLYYVHIGLGRHLPDVLASGTTLRQINIVRFASSLPYNTGITLVKLSALFFYARVFRDSRLFHIGLWATGALVVGWWITFDVLAICVCIPPRKLWDREIKGHCLDSFNNFVGASAPNIFIDVVILVLPLPILRKLRATLGRKLILAGVFVLGYCVVIVSIVRLVTTVALDQGAHGDFTWDTVKPILLIIVEIPLAIVSVCMPSIFHLVRRLYHGTRAPFGIEDPSSAIGGKLGEHIGGLGNPVDGEAGHVRRLIDSGVVETMSRDILLQDMYVSNRGEVLNV